MEEPSRKIRFRTFINYGTRELAGNTLAILFIVCLSALLITGTIRLIVWMVNV